MYTTIYLSILLWWIFGLFSLLLKQWLLQKRETVCIESLEAYSLKSRDVFDWKKSVRKRTTWSKSFAFVFQWPSNLIDPNQSLGIKANCITRFSCTSYSISYLLNHLTKVIQIWMNFKDFSSGLRVWICMGLFTFGSLFLFVLLIAFHKATGLS